MIRTEREGGGVPEGIVIYEGKLLWGDYGTEYWIAGLDENGLLYVNKMTPETALSLGIKYAASYGPALVINGVPRTRLYGGLNPRTAIGQRWMAPSLCLLSTDVP